LVIAVLETTVRIVPSTCVRAVAKMTPNDSSSAHPPDGERSTEVDPVVVPLVDLRLVDEHLRIAEVDHTRPRVCRKRRGGSGRGGQRRKRRAGEHRRQRHDCEDFRTRFHDDLI
jgi:hypothetical protein